MKPKQKQPHHVRNIFIGILVVLLVIPLMLYLYNLYLDHADQQKFVVLKQDMVALQKELTVIDQDWKYEEGCWRDGTVFNLKPSDCFISLDNKSIDDDKLLAVWHDTNFIIDRQTRIFNKEKDIREFTLAYKKDKSVNCSIYIKGTIGQSDDSAKVVSITCLSSARKYYYPQVR